MNGELGQTRASGFTYKETYQLYDEQLHYARAMYTLEQLDRWQTDWNNYFVRFGMEIPVYAHVVSKPKMHDSSKSTLQA